MLCGHKSTPGGLLCSKSLACITGKEKALPKRESLAMWGQERLGLAPSLTGQDAVSVSLSARTGVSVHQHPGKPVTLGLGVCELVGHADGPELATGLTLPTVSAPIVVQYQAKLVTAPTCELQCVGRAVAHTQTTPPAELLIDLRPPPEVGRKFQRREGVAHRGGPGAQCTPQLRQRVAC